jgi:hypothetical protein
VAERRTSALRILRPAESEPVPAPEPEEVPAAVATDAPPEADARPAAEEVFARLRADTASVGPPAGAAAPADHHPVPDQHDEQDDHEEADPAADLRRRDAELAPLERELARALKRALADEQNAVLDALRRSRSRPTLADLLPEPEAAVARYAEAATGPLLAAAAAGRAAVSAPPEADPTHVDDLATDVGTEVAAALRADVAAALEATGGDHAGTAERVSTAYRTWKGSLAEPLARSAALAAEARGRLAAATPLRWVPEPGTETCPDCAGNAAAAERPPGEPFPSGVPHPPAHAGCRCLVAPVDR